MGAYFAVTRWLIRDCVAAIVFFFAALVAVRSTVWLWAESPFWHTKNRKAEVFALAAFLAAWPVVLVAEKYSADPIRGSVQIAAVVVAIMTYWATRRFFQIPRDEFIKKET